MDGALDTLDAAINAALDRPMFALSDTELTTAVIRAQTAATRISVLLASMVAEVSSRGLCAKDGATSTATWLRQHVRTSASAGHRTAELGSVLSWPAIAEALRAGQINVEQALRIHAALTALPDDLDPEVRDRCTATLLDQAADLDADNLRQAGERILAHVAPEIGEAALAARLEREEALAARQRYLALTPTGSSRVRLSGSLDIETAALLRAAIEPLCKPIPTSDGSRDPRSAGQRRADALRDICHLALASDALPDRGGARPQLTVTIAYDAVTKILSHGVLPHGELVSAGCVRRLACDAQIIPAILGSDSTVLDMGRAQRLFTGAARRAVILRDGGCAFPGCDRPPRWCDVHHRLGWAHNGPTDLDNGILLCGAHHRAVHNDGWIITLGADRRPDFRPPAHIDPQQRPRRNTYHRRP